MLPAAAAMKLKNWIPPQIGWREFPHAQLVVVPAQDQDLVEFLAKRTTIVYTGGSRIAAEAFTLMTGLDSLTGQLQRYAAQAVTLGVPARQMSLPNELMVFCLGAWRLPRGRDLALLVSLDEPAAWPFAIEFELMGALKALHEEHRQHVAYWEAEKAAEEARHQELLDAHPQYKEVLEKGSVFGRAQDESWKPKVALGTLVSAFPCAAFIDAAPPKSAKLLQSAAVKAVAASGFRPSRNGDYQGIIAGMQPNRRGLVTWQPHLGLPSYPEIRWAVQKAIPRSMAMPRIDSLGRPKLALGSTSPDLPTSVQLPQSDRDWADVLAELPMDDADLGDRVDEVRGYLSQDGFEAIAWFQPYHEWTEETWGIYLDAKRLDNFALSIWVDCRDNRCPISFGLASTLAVGLITAHERFHARVEAASSWLELNARRPRFRRYQTDVYRALTGTSGWLEEALANWSAWEWFNNSQTCALLSQHGKTTDQLRSIIEGVLDLSPAGYRDWRLGEVLETWRTFAEQLASAIPDPASKRIAFPVESIFREPLPYDITTEDFPIWLVGPGNIADRLRSHPASFHVPSRREAEKVLRHFKHRHVPVRGKGSHETWFSPDGRGFPLPTRDPLSRDVFNSLLSHLGIDKATYVRDIRTRI